MRTCNRKMQSRGQQYPGPVLDRIDLDVGPIFEQRLRAKAEGAAQAPDAGVAVPDADEIPTRSHPALDPDRPDLPMTLHEGILHFWPFAKYAVAFPRMSRSIFTRASSARGSRLDLNGQ